MTLTKLNVDGGRRCERPDCRAWAVRDGSGLCAGHNSFAQAKARAAEELKRRHLGLPPLDSTKNARRWLALVGAAVAEGRLKPSVARELRLTASAYIASDQAGVLSDRIAELEDKVLGNGEEG